MNLPNHAYLNNMLILANQLVLPPLAIMNPWPNVQAHPDYDRFLQAFVRILLSASTDLN